MLSSSGASLLSLPARHVLVPVVETQVQCIQALAQPVVRAILLQHCSIFEFVDLAKRAARAGCALYVNMDHIDGIYADEASFRYLSERLGVKGLVSSHPKVLMGAKLAGLECIQRIFALDSTGLELSLTSVDARYVDMLDFAPARIVPHILPDLQAHVSLPYMASGWLRSVEQLQAVLASGVRAVAVTHLEKWL